MMSSFNEKKRKLSQRVESLIAFVKDLNEERITTRFEEFKEEIKSELTFNVLCLGDFSSGKSTFINQFFIKKSILPTSITPTTSRLTIIKYGEKQKIHLIYKDGSSKEISDNFENALSEYVAKDGDKLEQIEIAEVYINSDFLKEGVIIIDSPGLNDPEIERMEVTNNYIKKADSILYLLTATQSWKKSEKDFLEKKILIKEDLDKIFFLLNYWDLIEEEHREEVKSFVEEQVKISIDKVSKELGKVLSPPPIVPISAKTEENFDYLHKELWNYLGSKKGEEIINQKNKNLDTAKKDIKNLLSEKISVQNKEVTEISNTLKKLQIEIDKLKEDVDLFNQGLDEDVSEEVENWAGEIEEYYNNLQKEIEGKIIKKLENIDNEAKLKYEITKIISNVIYQEDSNLKKINSNFIKNVETIAKNKKARLELKHYDIKTNILKSNDFDKNMKESITPEIKNNIEEDILITGVSIVVAGYLGAVIAPPLTLLAIAGIIYSQINSKKTEKQEILRQGEIISEKINDFICTNINNIISKKDDTIRNILSAIKNDIVDAYEEKQKVYNEALVNKENCKENEVIASLQEKIDKLENL